jgi:uncharacterized protein YwqG
MLRAVDRLLEAYRKPAIMVHRPYPPPTLLKTRSRLGGLPLLPDSIEWPWGRDDDGLDVPLHFLAQIDCAELPRVDPRIPATGMMFFFGRHDDKQLWGDPKPQDDGSVIYKPQDDVRVIYAAVVPERQRERSPPPDLGPIRGSYPDVRWLLRDELGPSIHASWPAALLRIESWPDLSAICETKSYKAALGPASEKEFNALYDRRLAALRLGAVISATELPTRVEVTAPGWGTTVPLRGSTANETRIILPSDARGQAKPFPQAGIMIDRIARLVVKQAASYLAHPSYQKDLARKEKLAQAEAGGRSWINRANEIGLDAAPPEADVEGFTAWLNDLGSDIAAGSPRYSVLKADLPDILYQGMLSCVTFAAGSPRAAALIPPSFCSAFVNDHLPYEQAKRGDDVRLSAKSHQMLGHAPSCQGARPLNDDVVLLLQLGSDPGIDMSFGDLGEASFWISADDLAAMNFDEVWGDVVGH